MALTGESIDALLADVLDGIPMPPEQQLVTQQVEPAKEKRPALLAELGSTAFGPQFGQYLSFKPKG